MYQPPLSGRVVFVDWHGVLSADPFWMSIRNSATHPLRGQLESNLAEVFSRDSNVANEWMKGLLSSEQVIAAMDIQLDRRFRDDFLSRRLYADCAHMRVNTELFSVLHKVTPYAHVVLATDNMDCFLDTFDQVRQRRRRPTRPAGTLADWATICDGIICSSDVGALKAEDPVGFFGPYLSRHELAFTDAALIDDRADNCAAFAGHGGTPVPYKMSANHINDVINPLNRWLDAAVAV